VFYTVNYNMMLYSWSVQNLQHFET
jgi:hypothetical protein